MALDPAKQPRPFDAFLALAQNRDESQTLVPAAPASLFAGRGPTPRRGPRHAADTLAAGSTLPIPTHAPQHCLGNQGARLRRRAVPIGAAPRWPRHLQSSHHAQGYSELFPATAVRLLINSSLVQPCGRDSLSRPRT